MTKPQIKKVLKLVLYDDKLAFNKWHTHEISTLWNYNFMIILLHALSKYVPEVASNFLVNSYAPYERINRINYYEVVDLMEKLSL